MYLCRLIGLPEETKMVSFVLLKVPLFKKGCALVDEKLSALMEHKTVMQNNFM
ncbi:MAG: hypothetical protein JWR72_2918 [Flavisolibacter sp.]|nr:hypothetical protein [Flavisolibacter sp.]